MSGIKNKEGNPRNEILHQYPLSIYSEVDPLRTVAMWGRPGTPAVLAQLYPTTISLFQAHMDVPQAGVETGTFINVLQGFGVEVVVVRDHLAKILGETPRQKQSMGEVLDALVAKAGHIQDTYGESPFGRKTINEMLAHELEVDIDTYGESTALTLNYILSLSKGLPMGNIFFARDQANVLFRHMIRASMAKPIRKPEVSLYNMVYDSLHLGSPIVIPHGETFEGGDAYIHSNGDSDIVYVGVGGRTTMGAALSIYDQVKSDLRETGSRYALVVDPNFQDKTHEQGMDDMHLDTGGMPVRNGVKLVCEQEANNRRVYFVDDDLHGQRRITATNQSYIDHLLSEGNDVIAIPRDEQQAYQVNVLVIDEGHILVPKNSNETTTVKGLKQRGVEVIELGLEQCTKGYGAAHCMVNQLVRSQHKYDHRKAQTNSGADEEPINFTR